MVGNGNPRKDVGFVVQSEENIEGGNNLRQAWAALHHSSLPLVHKERRYIGNWHELEHGNQGYRAWAGQGNRHNVVDKALPSAEAGSVSLDARWGMVGMQRTQKNWNVDRDQGHIVTENPCAGMDLDEPKIRPQNRRFL